MNHPYKLGGKLISSLIIGLIIILIPSSIKAQLFVDNELYPNVLLIKGKYYNGTGRGRFWSLDYLDSIGRVIKTESYHNTKLISCTNIEYDDHNNIIFTVPSVDFNNSMKIDTFYEYKYNKNGIIYQFQKLSNHGSRLTELIKIEGDTIFKYQERTSYYRAKTGETDIYEIIYTLKYKNNLLISKEIYKKQDNSKEITTYEYYDNGRLKRRSIQRIPKPIIKSHYSGGPGSDDEFYEYKLDSKGRILKFYKIIEGKKYKIAVYKYYEN